MRELIHIEDSRSQLRCDNVDCFHELPKGAVTWGEHLIGFPCPWCGENMLTREDYVASERIFRTIKWINKWFGWLGRDYAKHPEKFDHSLSVHHHAGDTDIKVTRR